MGGYRNNPNETEAAFRDGLFRTGGIGYQDAEGYFFIRDRRKDMIITGGENVSQPKSKKLSISQRCSRLLCLEYLIPQRGGLVMAIVTLKPGDDSERTGFDHVL
jgi:long-subunit acyl-CoA synthetase (AMP-forming)